MIFEAIIIGSIVILFILALNKKNRTAIYTAAIISFIWVYFSGLYSYRGVDYVILGLNLFAFFAWTAGLVLVKKLYDWKFEGKHLFGLFAVIYLVGISVVEYIGYNLWNIKLASDYPGLLGYPLMHMPWWGQLYYLTIGLLFVKLSQRLNGKHKF